MSCRLTGLLLLVFLLGPLLTLQAEQTVLHRFIPETVDAELEDILYLTLGIELADAGFSSTRTDEKAVYILEIGYVTSGSGVDIRLTLFDSIRPLAETSGRLELDYAFDTAISAMVTELLTKADLANASAQPSEIQGLFSHPGTMEGMSPEQLAAAMATRVDVTIGSGGMVFFGKMTEMFRYGVTAALTAGIRVPRKKWSIEPGLRLTATRVLNDSGVSGGPLYFSTAGVNLYYGTGYRTPFRFAGVFSGGAAVLSLVDDGVLLNKTIPYVDAGFLIRIPLGKKRWFAGLDLRYLAAFDRDLLIMGTLPVLSLSKEF